MSDTNRPHITVGVDVSLRDRIAAVLDKALPASAGDVGFYQRLGVTPLVDIEAYDLNLELLADAVVRELGLTRESAQDGIAPVDDPPVGQHRYVTDWMTDDE